MSAIDAVNAVTDRLKTVAGIGPNVYSMVRAAVTDADFQAIFVNAAVSPNLVQAWQVTREATKSEDEVLNAMSRTHQVKLYGYMGFQDGISEPVFQEQIEAVCAAYDSYENGSALRRFVSDAYPNGRFDWSGPMQVESVRLGMLGNVLVHAAQLVYPVREFPV